MTERLRRALARQKFFEGWRNVSPVSRLGNSFGQPIGKPVCIRSMRRLVRVRRAYNLKHDKDGFGLMFLRGMNAKDFRNDLSHNRIVKDVRYLKKEYARLAARETKDAV